MLCHIQLLLQLISAILRKLFVFMLIISNHYGIKCVSNLIELEPCNVMFKVISDKMGHWNNLWNTIFISINICNAKKMICALSMFMISNHYGTKCLSTLLQ